MEVTLATESMGTTDGMSGFSRERKHFLFAFAFHFVEAVSSISSANYFYANH